MNVDLIDNSLTFMFGCHQCSPVHWEDTIYMDLQKLIREGVIAKWTRDEAPQYLSPPKWVEKWKKLRDPLKLWLMTNLHILNINTRRLSMLFPSCLEIWK